MLLLFSQFTFGQNPYYYSIDRTNGLPSNSVYDIFQDSKGFMWFATGKGLCRYDGSVFKTFTSDIQTSKSGSCINEDSFGRIWYINFDGYLYYVENGELKNLPQKESVGYIKFGIIEDKLFLIQTKSVAVYDLKTLQLVYTYHLKDEYIRATYTSNSKFYFVGEHIYEIDYPNKIKTYPLTEDFRKTLEVPIIQELNNEFFVVSKFSNYYYTYKENQLSKKKFNSSFDFIQNLAIIDNAPWLCTPNGIIKYENEKATTYFSDFNVSYIFKDKQQNYWISTVNSGLLFIQDFKNNFIPLSPKPTVFSSYDNQLLIGTENDLIFGLQLNDLSVNTVYKNNSNHPINQIIGNEKEKNIYFTSSKFKILNNQNIVSNEKSFAVKDIKKIDDTYYSFAASGICGLFKVSDKKSKWDSLHNKNLNAPSNFNESALIKSNGKSTAFNPENNCIYYATNMGLKFVNSNGVNEIKFQNKTLYVTNLQSYKNTVYALSTSEELYKIDSKNTVTKVSIFEKHLKERFTKFKIQENSIFIFTTNGIIEYNLIKNNYRKILPLTSDLEVTDVAIVKDQIYFATSKGIIVKNKFKNKEFTKPELIINEIKVNGILYKENNLSELEYNQNDITVNFSVLSFIPNEKKSVLYKINDGNWNRLDADNKNLILSSLSPGDYNLFLKIDANYETKIKQIDFKINKPFWLNTFFLIYMSLIIIALLYTFYKYQIQKIEKKNQLLLDKVNLEKNLNQSKLKAIKSQMNPHFFYNALNTIQSYILSNDKKQAVSYLSKFSTLTRTILEMSEKENITLSEEIKTLGLYLDIEKARFDEDFSYEINIAYGIDIENIKIPSMLLQPYVENAVKHGLLHKKGEKKLTIDFERIFDSLKITIDDNGIGRQKSAELNAIKNKDHLSFATEAMQNRIALLNQYKQKNIAINFDDKFNKNEQSLGTKVIIEIPITY
ncbi:two component regulator with propeller domain [Flavobacterium cheniae]|uniref:Two component regulator with propeller domain n=1 Tax=Flavobacterium cheniae TaxID=295428 RepID=A0A562KF90_9FLAO|nr:two component regulator with propeller domain [Flavobacterium cheniae]TWH94088.1 two component regulator with propeller domain [Flavobacterium cheniae]